MKALVYVGPGQAALQDRPDPALRSSSDAVVRLTATSICGTDLHIVRGEIPGVLPGRILGHEGVGVVQSVGADVGDFRPGDRVLISLNTSCGRCPPCRKGLPSHCRSGGWLLGNSIDGTQAEFVRIPFADNGLLHLDPDISDEAAVLLSCCFPTAHECGVLAARVKPGDRIAIVGAGPVGLATLLTSQLYTPAEIIMVDLDAHRLASARSLGATHLIESTGTEARDQVLDLTRHEGVDAAVEAVGLPQTFDLCQSILGPGGHLANLGVHSAPVTLRLDQLWSANLVVTTGLVDGTSIPVLLSLVRSGRLDPRRLISHRFAFNDILTAYDTFTHAARDRAVKVIVSGFASTK